MVRPTALAVATSSRRCALVLARVNGSARSLLALGHKADGARDAIHAAAVITHYYFEANHTTAGFDGFFDLFSVIGDFCDRCRLKSGVSWIAIDDAEEIAETELCGIESHRKIFLR